MDIRYALTADGVRIGYSEIGDGPALVFVRGWITHLELMWREPSFRAFVEALAQRFRVIRFDARGNGVSDREVDRPDLGDFVVDVEAVIGAAGVDRCLLWGSSFGGPIAIAYAARYPERVDRLVLEGTYPTWVDTRTAQHRRSIADLMRMLESSPEMATTAISYVTDPAPGSRHEERARRIRSSVSAEYLGYLYVLATKFDVREEVEQITAPTLVLHARDSQVFPARDAQVLAAAFRDARYVELDGGQHNPWEGAAAVAIDAVCHFAGMRSARYDPPGRNRVSVIMFTDLVASTSMTDRYGDLIAAGLRRNHDAIVAAAVSEHGGDLVKFTGDGALARFYSASSALRAANRIVGAAEQQNDETDGPSLAVRVGLNAGEPIEEAGDLHGSAVNLAARVCSDAEGNEVLVSAAVRDLASGKGFHFSDRGRTLLKGFSEPTRLFRLERSEAGSGPA
ncbi:MAG: adenylate/guanylate cyclase domain-containing protein [Acidimicrobiia bacterium]